MRSDGISGGGGMKPFFRSMAIAASGLSAQRARIETIANNIANAETTRTADGMPYRRKMVQLSESPFAELDGSAAGAAPAGASPDGDAHGGVEVVEVVEDTSPGAMIYDPGHPDADEAGYVEMPNVRITDEIVDLMEARRMYEANVTVFEAVKAMLRRAAQL
jgi:flagellar basal-body rod protein FlgC